MKLIVAGSRGFLDNGLMWRTLNEFAKGQEDLTIISGTARGADQLGEQWAKQYGAKLIRMPAEWDRYGRSAGYRRNEEMAKIATHCVLFWDGKSPGTQHMLNIATRYKLNPIMIVSKPTS